MVIHRPVVRVGTDRLRRWFGLTEADGERGCQAKDQNPRAFHGRQFYYGKRVQDAAYRQPHFVALNSVSFIRTVRACNCRRVSTEQKL